MIRLRRVLVDEQVDWPDLVASVQSAKQWLTFSNAAPLQPAVAHALTREAGFYDDLAKELQAKRHLLVDTSDCCCGSG